MTAEPSLLAQEPAARREAARECAPHRDERPVLPVLVAGALICLSRFPIEQLKIDKSFTAELGGYQGAKRDDPDQLERVREPGCDYAQAFLFARRMDAFRATSLINAGATIGSLTAKAS